METPRLCLRRFVTSLAVALLLVALTGAAHARSVADDLSTLVDERITDTDTVLELWRMIEALSAELDAFDEKALSYRDEMSTLMLKRSTGPGEFGRLLRESSKARVDAEQGVLDIHTKMKPLVPPALWPEFAGIEARGISRLAAIYRLYGQAGARSVSDYIEWVTPALKANLYAGDTRYATVRRTLQRIESLVAEHNELVRRGEAEIVRLNQSYDTPREAFQSVLNRLDAARSSALREIVQYRVSLRYMMNDGEWERIFKPGPLE